MRRFLAALIAVLFAAPALAGTAPNYTPPFGLWRMPADQAGNMPYNLNGVMFDPSTNTPADVFAALNAARAAHAHLFVQLVNFADLQENPPGNFQLSNWQARYNQWCPSRQCLNLQSYVADGTLVAAHLFEYSAPPNPGNAKTPTLDQIQQVAAYVKTLWPYLPTAIDSAHPAPSCTNWSHAVDMVLITAFTMRQTDLARGDRAIDGQVACARQAGLRFTLGPNPFGGSQGGLAPTSLDTFVHYTEFSLMYPGKVGTIIWRWWPGDTPTKGNGVQNFSNFWSEQVNPGIGAAMREIQACAANPTPSSCPHGQRGG